MYQIIRIDETTVAIGTDDNRIVNVPKSTLGYDDPQVGDRVRIYKNEDTVIIVKDNDVQRAQAQPQQDTYQSYSYGNDSSTYGNAIRRTRAADRRECIRPTRSALTSIYSCG